MSASPSIALAWRIAKRELRGGLAGFRVFVICLALGVAAITVVNWTSSAVVGGLEADARKLLGGDMELRLVHRPSDAEEKTYLQANSTRLSETVSLRAMASAGKNATRTLVELKAVDDAYPLVGNMALSPDLTRAQMFAGGDDLPGAVVDAGLLTRLGIGVGDTMKIGKATFRINAVIDREPDRVTSVINYGPRVMIARPGLAETGLVQPGSLIRYYYRVLLADGIDPASWRTALAEAFPDAGWRVRATDEAAPGVRRFI
ncbi:MAG: ABC transporter permease, partial [Rhodospirillales bacterium]